MDDPKYLSPAKAKFLSKADPWLIAKAKSIQGTVVTHEVYDPGSKKSVKIPNVCKAFDVPYTNTFEILLAMEAKFGLL